MNAPEGPLVRLEGEYVGDLGAGRVGGGVSGRISYSSSSSYSSSERFSGALGKISGANSTAKTGYYTDIDTE